jgi:hypothetical protein
MMLVSELPVVMMSSAASIMYDPPTPLENQVLLAFVILETLLGSAEYTGTIKAAVHIPRQVDAKSGHSFPETHL